MMTLLEWLADSAVSLSVILALILLLRRPLARLLGSVTVYRLWLLVPLHLAGLLWLAPHGPHQAAPLTWTLEPLVVRLETTSAAGLSAWSVLVWLWGTGVALSLVRLLREVIQASRLRHNSHSADSRDFAARLAPVARIRVSTDVETAVVVGFLRPTMLIPQDFGRRYSPEEQRLILQHEARHLRRRDNLFNLLARLLRAVFWFNPLAHLAHAAYRRDQELSCDAQVLQHASGGQRQTYGRALIKSVISAHALALTSSWQSGSPLKERTMMLKLHRSTPARSVAGLVLLVALSAGAAGLSTNALALQGAAEAPRAPLSPIERVPPQYPRPAAEQRLEGRVVMELTIDADGRVQEVSVVESQPQGVFDEAAVSAMEQWRFEPPVLKDGATTVTAVQTLLFELEPPAPAAAPAAPASPASPASPAPPADPAPRPAASPAPARHLSVVPAAWSVATDDC